MPSCDYCDRQFEDDESYLDHLDSAHYDDLDRIDKRRVDGGDEDAGVSTTMIAAVAVVGLLVVGGGAYAMLSLNGTADYAELPEVQKQPTDLRAEGTHEHGTIVAQIEGHRFDFSRGEYQLNDEYFHFEGGQGEQFHVHANGVTLQYALHTLGIGVTKDTVVWRESVYERSDAGTTITIEVDGEPVDPATYVLGEGDRVELRVETTG